MRNKNERKTFSLEDIRELKKKEMLDYISQYNAILDQSKKRKLADYEKERFTTLKLLIQGNDFQLKDLGLKVEKETDGRYFLIG